MCFYSSEPETTAQFLLCCKNHKISQSKFLKPIYNLDQILLKYDDNHLIHNLPMVQKNSAFL